MARPSRSFDVWMVTANTVYKNVPFQVVAEWVQGGRLATADRVRTAARKDEAWLEIEGHPFLAAYLPKRSRVSTLVQDASESIEELDPAEPRPRRRRHDEDDDPDMIPLIDISLVLLIFFMMIRASGALSPVDVPDMQFTGELKKEAITIAIERKSAEDVVYSVRVGESVPQKDHANLPNPEAAITALDQLLASAQKPPDVRIACAKELPNERVYELVRDLKIRKDRNLINAYDAEVNEKAAK